MDKSENIPEFGTKRDNEERRDGGCAVVFDPVNQKYAVYKNLKNGLWGFFGGGFEENEGEKEGVLRELVEESGLFDFLYIEKIGKVLAHYYNTNKETNRVALATCFLVILKSTNRQQTKLEEHERLELVWASPKEILKNFKLRNKNKDCDHWIYLLEKSAKRAIELGYDTSNQAFD